MALDNIRERLALHFDAEASLESRITRDSWEVHIRMPYRTQKPAAERQDDDEVRTARARQRPRHAQAAPAARPPATRENRNEDRTMAEPPLRVLIVDDEAPGATSAARTARRLRRRAADRDRRRGTTRARSPRHPAHGVGRPRPDGHPHARDGWHRAGPAFAQAFASTGRYLHDGVPPACARRIRGQCRRLSGQAGACTAIARCIAEGATIEANDDREAHPVARRRATLPVGH